MPEIGRAAQDRLRKTGVVAGATLASRVLGFLRDMVVAMALGAGPQADAFFVAFRIPEALRRLLGEGTFSMAVTPALAQARARGGPEGLHQLARSLTGWGLCLLVPLTVFAMVHAADLLPLVAPGFSADPDLQTRTASLLAVCLPYVLTTFGAGMCISLLHVQGRFLSAALSPCLLNVVLIAAAGLGLWVGWDVAFCLAGALLVAGVGQVALQWPTLRRTGFRWLGPTPLAPPELWQAGREMLPAMLGASAFQCMLMLASFRGTLLGVGTASALYYADRLLQFPLGLAGVAVSTVAMPELAALHARGDREGFARALRHALRLSLFLSLPATAGLVMLARPVVELLFVRGAFDPVSAALTTSMLEWMALSLPGLALTRPLLAASYARGGHRQALLAGCAGLVAFAVAEAALEWVAGPRAPALALGAGVWTQTAVLGRGSELPRAREDVAWLVRVGLLCAMMAAGIAGLGLLLPAASAWQVAGIPAWGALYFGGAAALQVSEGQLILQAFRQRK